MTYLDITVCENEQQPIWARVGEAGKQSVVRFEEDPEYDGWYACYKEKLTVWCRLKDGARIYTVQRDDNGVSDYYTPDKTIQVIQQT